MAVAQPPAPSRGDQYTDASGNRFVHNGTGWVAVRGIAFPAAPARGDHFNDANSSQRYTWDGEKWIGNAAGIRKVEPITQAAYTALATKDPTVLYLISA